MYSSRKKDSTTETDPYAFTTVQREPSKNGVELRARSPAKNKNHHQEKELTKLEMNLRRFEEERRKFEQEKEKFEREKKRLERIRFNRLLEFERKRMIQRLEKERLVAEVDAGQELQENDIKSILEIYRRRSKSREDDRVKQIRSTELLENNRGRSHSFGFGDDYESSTAESLSSREADFDMYEDDASLSVEEMTMRPPSILKNRKPLNVEQNLGSPNLSLTKDFAPVTSPKQSLLARILFGTGNKKKKAEKVKPTHTIDIYDIYKTANDDSPISIKHILWVETRVIWQNLLKDYPVEWEETKLLRNRCISDFIIISIFFGAGGLAFRFIEGAFENFYKCGVRRVKRDFIDHLWLSSHNLRC